MNKWLLSILLASWSLVIANAESCDTGTAKSGEVLSVQRSLLANADVALLKGYNASSLSVCLKECCTAKYGACSVAVFKKSNTTESICIHYNCRPILKCKFLPSEDYDSFIFPALPAQHTSTTTTTSVPSTFSASSLAVTDSDQPNFSVTKEEIATFSEEELDLKNDNTTIKPRKGVEDDVIVLSGSKPRKGAVFSSLTSQPSRETELYLRSSSSSTSFSSSTIDDVNPTRTVDHFVSSAVVDNESQSDNLLEFIFEDDPSENISVSNTHEDHITVIHTISTTSNSVSSTDQNEFSSTLPNTTTSEYYSSTSVIEPSSIMDLHFNNTHTPSLNYSDSSIHYQHTDAFTPSYSVYSESSTLPVPLYSENSTLPAPLYSEIRTLPAPLYSEIRTLPAPIYSEMRTLPISDFTTASPSGIVIEHKTSYYLDSSVVLATSAVPPLVTQTSSVYSKVPDTDVPTSTVPEVINADAQSYQATNKDDEESEKERKYQSSMHLVLSLVFGLLVLFAVIGVVARRVYDGWMTRHYRRMDFLIDGMYNGSYE